uniref:ABC transporter substrate-binding protein n=1 Tax=Castellaniella defragrans TaxID=75697 RepID=UPI003342AF28
MNRTTIATLMAGYALALSTTFAQAAEPLTPRIGILTDMAGTYSDISGQGSVIAAEMAVEDFYEQHPEVKGSVIFGDHRNKTDVGAAMVRDWIDNEGVDVVAELTTSSVALAAQRLTNEKDKLLLITGAGSSDLTGKSCAPNTIAWVYDTYATANGTGRAMVGQGGKTWFMVQVDYAFGEALARDAIDAVKVEGGTIIGTAKHPLSASDLSSPIFAAVASKAQVIGLAHAGGDLITSIKQAKEFGVTEGGQKLAALLIYISDVHAIGLDAAQGLYLTTGFYWDRTDESRAWSKRFFERRQAMPTMAQAGVYSSVMHYLEAVRQTGSTDTGTVRKKMGEMKVNDMFTKDGYIRADGRMMHDLYLAQVKSPAESKYPWDYFKIVATIPAEDAFRRVEDSECPLLKN